MHDNMVACQAFNHPWLHSFKSCTKLKIWPPM